MIWKKEKFFCLLVEEIVICGLSFENGVIFNIVLSDEFEQLVLQLIVDAWFLIGGKGEQKSDCLLWKVGENLSKGLFVIVYGFRVFLNNWTQLLQNLFLWLTLLKMRLFVGVSAEDLEWVYFNGRLNSFLLCLFSRVHNFFLRVVSFRVELDYLVLLLSNSLVRMFKWVFSLLSFEDLLVHRRWTLKRNERNVLEDVFFLSYSVDELVIGRSHKVVVFEQRYLLSLSFRLSRLVDRSMFKVIWNS